MVSFSEFLEGFNEAENKKNYLSSFLETYKSDPEFYKFLDETADQTSFFTLVNNHAPRLFNQIVTMIDVELRDINNGKSQALINLTKFFVIIINSNQEVAASLISELLKKKYNDVTILTPQQPLRLNSSVISIGQVAKLVDVSFLHLIVATKQDALLDELAKMKSPFRENLLFQVTTSNNIEGAENFNLLHAAAYYNPDSIIQIASCLQEESLLSLLQENATIVKEDLRSKWVTPLHLAAMTEEGSKQILPLLKKLSEQEKASETSSGKQEKTSVFKIMSRKTGEYIESSPHYDDYLDAPRLTKREGYTVLHLLAMHNPQEIKNILPLLGADAWEVCDKKNDFGMKAIDLLVEIQNHKDDYSISFQKSIQEAKNEILIANANFSGLYSEYINTHSKTTNTSNYVKDATTYLSTSISTYLVYYFSPKNYTMLIDALNKLGRIDSIKGHYTHMAQTIALELTNALPESFSDTKETYKSIVENVILFLLDHKLEEQKNIAGIKELIPVLFDQNLLSQGPDVFYGELIKVLAARQLRHDHFKRQAFRTDTVDPKREANQLFTNIKTTLLQEKNLHNQTYSQLHPCGVAYRLVVERMDSKSYNPQQVHDWFMQLVKAKKDHDVNRMGKLLEYQNRPTKFMTSSKNDPLEAEFKKSIERFCEATPSEMNEFWQKVKEDALTDDSNPLLNSLMELHPTDPKVNLQSNPGVIAYNLVLERMQSRNEKEKTAGEWFYNLLKAKKDYNTPEIKRLMSHGNRPSNSMSFSRFNEDEGKFTKALWDFCSADEPQMEQFWKFISTKTQLSSAEVIEQDFVKKLDNLKLTGGHTGNISLSKHQNS